MRRWRSFGAGGEPKEDDTYCDDMRGETRSPSTFRRCLRRRNYVIVGEPPDNEVVPAHFL